MIVMKLTSRECRKRLKDKALWHCHLLAAVIPRTVAADV
jgi:hypothetical protein